MGDGGGLARAVPLSADLVARAVIAAARVFGDDPVKGCLAKREISRRCLTPAAEAVADACGLSLTRAAHVLDIRAQNFSRSRETASYKAAVAAAARALRYARWRPEAAESVVGSEPASAIAPAGGEDVLEISASRPDDIEDETTEIAERAEVEPLEHISPLPQIRAIEPASCPPPDVELPRSAWPIRDLILEALAEGAMNSSSLASRLDRKEMPVCSALALLEREGLVTSHPVETGPRRLEWALAEAAAA